jgi:hypothetical protein
MARQGQAFATADFVRVVYPTKDSDPHDVDLVDVPRDGKTTGEIVTRGNIVMKEVGLLSSIPYPRIKTGSCCSISETRQQQRRLSGEGISVPEIWLLWTRMGR